MAKRRTAGKDGFVKDKIGGEYEKPGPRINPDAAGIASGLAKLAKREKTGFVLNWLPLWAKRALSKPFSFYFFEDGLVVDVFGRDVEEMDALAEGLTQTQYYEMTQKIQLCRDNGLKYLSLGPDDDLDMTQLAALLGRTTFKKETGQVRRTAKVAGDGIEEEELQ